MLSEELKNLILQFGTLVIVENNQPKFVILSYEKFKGVIHKSIDNLPNFDKYNSERINIPEYQEQADEEAMDRLNREILALKEQVAEKEKEITDNP